MPAYRDTAYGCRRPIEAVAAAGVVGTNDRPVRSDDGFVQYGGELLSTA